MPSTCSLGVTHTWNRKHWGRVDGICSTMTQRTRSCPWRVNRRVVPSDQRGENLISLKKVWGKCDELWDSIMSPPLSLSCPLPPSSSPLRVKRGFTNAIWLPRAFQCADKSEELISDGNIDGTQDLPTGGGGERRGGWSPEEKERKRRR